MRMHGHIDTSVHPDTFVGWTNPVQVPFFSNMVPEGANRRVICRSLRIDENDFFGILEAMADKDFIGAVNIRRINND